MKLITEVRIDNFRGLRDFRLEGARMFNLLVGPNEIGKTSVLEAICLLSMTGGTQDFVRINRMRGANIQNQTTATAAVASMFHNFRPSPISLGMTFIPNEKFGSMRVSVEVLPFLGDKVVSYKEMTADAIDASGESSLFGQFNRLKRTIDVSGPVIARGHSILHLDSDDVRNAPFEVEQVLSRSGKNGETLPLSAEETEIAKCNMYYLRHNDPLTAMAMALENKKKDAIIEVLKDIDPQIADFSLLPDAPHVDIGLNKTVSMHITGDGVRAVLSTLGHLCSQEYNVYLEDEMGMGIYYARQKTFLRAILRFARMEGKQIFAATHSKDVLTALKDVLAEEDDLREDATVFSFLRDKRGMVRAVPYLYEEIDHCISSGMEIR